NCNTAELNLDVLAVVCKLWKNHVPSKVGVFG
ncbi:hypothetical protein A2U01_0104546, partial [Trifolium medium]|nr:hypothetical protein [Trifolium medium]